MGIITEKTTLYELNQEESLIQMRDKLVGGFSSMFYGDSGKDTLKQYYEKNPALKTEDLLFGMRRMQEIAKETEQYVFCPAPEKDYVHLIYMPAKKKKTDSFVILNAGGAYLGVFTFGEAIPVGARLNELGIDCFCLNYTVATQVDLTKGLMPEPLKDLAAAWMFINERKDTFSVNPEEYYVGGFSAGGHLTALWGTQAGAPSFEIPLPLGLMLAYPLISADDISGEAGEGLRGGLSGNDPVKAAKYHNVHQNITANYPKTYLVQAMDDESVPISHSYLMETALKEKKIPCRIDRYEKGSHGFGYGSGLGERPWIDTAVEYLDILV